MLITLHIFCQDYTLVLVCFYGICRLFYMLNIFFVNKNVESVLGFSGALEGKKFSNCISILLDD